MGYEDKANLQKIDPEPIKVAYLYYRSQQAGETLGETRNRSKGVMKLFANLTKRVGSPVIISETEEQAEQHAKMVPVLCKVLEALKDPFQTMSKEDVELIVAQEVAKGFVGHRSTTKGWDEFIKQAEAYGIEIRKNTKGR